MLEDYHSRTGKSRDLYERATRVFPSGVSHNIRTFGMPTTNSYPPYIERGKGGHIWDIDGNEYIDWWMTHYSMILGHSNPDVAEAIRKRLDDGHHFGAPTEPQVKYGEEIQRAVPILEKMRFTATGSESTMYAVRMARLFTGRPLVGKALSGWHGGNDALAFHLKYPYSDEPFYNGVSFDFNDRESLDEMLRQHGKELAAIIVEPVVGAGGGLPPEDDFLSYLREETESKDILLIFDEIVTGFRLRYGTAGDGVFGVTPDLLTLGKAAAGGMPLGVYGGREDVMALANPGAKGGRWVGGGTFSSHPLTMEAGLAVLEQLRTKGDDYARLNKMGDDFRKRLNDMLKEREAPLIATGFGSINFISSLTHRPSERITTPGELGKLFDHTMQDTLQALLMQEGVFGYHGLGALSFAHTEDDIERTLLGISNAIEKMP
ncbi:aminotransferase class III-fold pyridoxal phosphate-dependent enzyme [Candidatus Thorarchaeota archaeon]|nr:MAG: aminotransferase class III-fold pyridoxal phosphate-dependent enzyme [Candidatus Thorarchaeota archaeon]